MRSLQGHFFPPRNSPLLKSSGLGPGGRRGAGQGGPGGEFFRTASNKTLVWNTPAKPPDLPDLPDLPDVGEVVAASAPQTLPSTRAGGQDDVS